MNPTDVALRYFAGMRARNLADVSTLFAQDATFVLPDGKAFTGVDAIREMYTKLFAMSAPLPTPVAMIAGKDGVATEIETQLADGSIRRTANFFHLDGEGRIKRLSVYTRTG